ncbi:hypothetical protein [Bradyrhizobium japonicum]|uniref:hypothetical protein n=1 Tax=Bradyrhizobium japonicum TaxID=375 RepID=UPI0012BBB6AF|nr:hypothetical protein [Bradyrhizobium japonicum]
MIALVAGGLSQSSAQLMPPGGCNLLLDKTIAANPNSFDTTALDKLNPENRTKLFTSGLPCQENIGFGDDGIAKTPIEKIQRAFDFYSWLTFIALNRPLDDLNGFAVARPSAKTWWESGANFKPLLDVMLPDGSEPAWESEVVPPACRAKTKPNQMLVKMIEESFNQPFKTGPLIDQNNNYAIFDILMNKSMFDYIVKHKLYSRAEQARNTGLRIDFPVGRQMKDGAGVDDHGAIMLKVSWKILDSDDDKSKFHHVQALVAMPPSPDEQGDPPCIEKTIGLVGFHVVHKTVGRPQWIWTSFEHIDNVPDKDDIADFRNKRKLDPTTKARRFNFYTLSCSDGDCPVNETPPRPWDPEYKHELKFRTNAKGQVIFNSQIVREPALTLATKKMNEQFHALLSGSVWKNYILIGTQWPSDQKCTGDHSVNQPDPKTDFEKEPDMNCAPAPTFLANSTLETYSQGTIPQASSSCMGCHGNAVSYQRALRPTKPNDAPPKTFNQSDFTFMLEKAR